MLGVEIHNDEDPNGVRTGLGIDRKMYSSDSSANVYVYEALSGIGDDAFMVTNKIPATMPPEMYGRLTDQQMLFAVKGAKKNRDQVQLCWQTATDRQPQGAREKAGRSFLITNLSKERDAS